MKKIILLFAASLITCLNIYAQKFHFGLGFTPSMAWLHSGTDEFKGDGSKLGFNYGLITEFAITENYSFATGITIDTKGGKLISKTPTYDSAGVSTTFSGNYTLSYLQIPATLKMKTNPIGYIRYYGEFGLAPAFCISAKGTYQSGSTIIAEDADIKPDINNFNISLVIGGGIEYNLSGNTNLLLGIKYFNGFSDIASGSNKVNANTLGLNIGVLF